MSASPSVASGPEHYSESRATVLNEAFNALLLLNGGGSSLLIAFLQDHWKESPDLAIAILTGVAYMALGLVFAIPIPLLRYRHSHLWEDRERKRTEGANSDELSRHDAWRKPYVCAYLSCYTLSMACFTGGTAFIVARAFVLLLYGVGAKA